MKTISLLFSAVCLAAGLANAQNLLLNGDFNSPAGTPPTSYAFPDSWSDWAWPDWNNAWVNRQNDGSTFDGSPYMAIGNGNGGDYSVGLYQVVGATAGSTYTLSVESGAQAWWRPEGEMRLIFLDAGNNILSQNTLATVDPGTWSGNDVGQPWALFSVTGTAPDNTFAAKAEFVMNGGQAAAQGGGTVWFDNASLTVVPEPGTLALAALGAVLLLAHQRRNARPV